MAAGRHIPVELDGWNADQCGCGNPKDRRARQCRDCYSRMPSKKCCTKCRRSLPIADFYLRSSGRPLQHCKSCVSSRRPKAEYSRATRARAGHYKHVAARLTQRRKSDPLFKIADNLRRNLRQMLKRQGGAKPCPTLELLGCTVEQFRRHIETQWRPGMSWSNYGPRRDCWQFDHILPVASFDLNDPEQIRRCFHFTNYQPLWTPENAAKGARH